MCRPDCPVSLGVSVATVTIPERYNASLLLDRNLEAGRQDMTAILSEDESLTYGELFARACGAPRCAISASSPKSGCCS